MDQKVSYENYYKNIEDAKEPTIVVNNYTKDSKIIDGIKFGIGFYIGFKLARTLKYFIMAKITKK